MHATSQKLNICVAQINYDQEDVAGHIAKIMAIVQEYREADLLVLPELILHGHPSPAKPEGYLFRRVRAVDSRAIDEVHRHIRRLGARVILGELKRRGDRYFNMAAYVDRRGVQTYLKTHVHWTENFVPGPRLKCFDTPFGPLGVNICFDSAFAETWRVLALMGAEVAVNISAVPATFAARHMRRRMSGAAAFNQFCVVYANRPGPVFSGNSAVYGPTGDELVRAGTRELVFTAELDLEEVRAWRREERIFEHRRPHLYREVANRNKRLELVGPAPEDEPGAAFG